MRQPRLKGIFALEITLFQREKVLTTGCCAKRRMGAEFLRICRQVGLTGRDSTAYVAPDQGNPEGGCLVNQETTMTGKSNMRTKIIKRYQNRKLYDTQQSCYVTLDDIANKIRSSEDVMVIDNKSKNDITAATLTQIIF